MSEELSTWAQWKGEGPAPASWWAINPTKELAQCSKLGAKNMNIKLNAKGGFTLYQNDYSIDLPLSLAGLNFIAGVLRGQQMGQTKLGQLGAPTQAAVKEALRRWKDEYGNVISWNQKKREKELMAIKIELEL